MSSINAWKSNDTKILEKTDIIIDRLMKIESELEGLKKTQRGFTNFINSIKGLTISKENDELRKYK